MSDMKKINHNSIIKVKLNADGKAVYRKEYGHDPDVDENGFSEFSFWIYMWLFGPAMMAGQTLIEDGCIYMQTKDLEPVD